MIAVIQPTSFKSNQLSTGRSESSMLSIRSFRFSHNKIVRANASETAIRTPSPSTNVPEAYHGI